MFLIAVYLINLLLLYQINQKNIVKEKLWAVLRESDSPDGARNTLHFLVLQTDSPDGAFTLD